MEVVLVLELGHGLPVALGHVGLAELGVMAFFDLDGVVEGFPEAAVLGLRGGGGGHFKGVHRDDGPLSAAVDQGLVVGAVVEEEGLVVHTVAEVGAQEGEDAVFGRTPQTRRSG